jgi:Ca2+-binding RTX toxin-like protein
VAGSGADLLVVTDTAGTILTGGTGHDTFAFPNVMGHDEVTNFGIAKDTLRFNMTQFSNFAAAMNHAQPVRCQHGVHHRHQRHREARQRHHLTASNFHFT